jgi:hypothetical protein
MFLQLFYLNLIAPRGKGHYPSHFYFEHQFSGSLPYRRFKLTKKSATGLAIICALLIGSIVLAQEANQTETQPDAAQNAAMLKVFARSTKIDGVTLNFVLLNDHTVDALFQGAGKYAIRARANMATTFYIMGTPEKDITLDTGFSVEQDGKQFTGQPINIKNFKTGTVAKGTKIDGLVQLAQKLDLAHPFTIKGAHNSSVEFKLSEEALKLMTN